MGPSLSRGSSTPAFPLFFIPCFLLLHPLCPTRQQAWGPCSHGRREALSSPQGPRGWPPLGWARFGARTAALPGSVSTVLPAALAGPGGGGREAPRVDARPAASSRAGWAALPHVQLSRRHLASPPGRQPSLPLVLGSPPPRHGMKLKAIIKIVSPNPGQTSQSELARAVPVAGGWGRNSCPQGIRWGKRSLAGFPPPPTPKQPSCFPSRLLCRGRTSAGMRVLSFPLSRHILVRRRCKSWSKPFVLSGL